MVNFIQYRKTIRKSISQRWRDVIDTSQVREIRNQFSVVQRRICRGNWWQKWWWLWLQLNITKQEDVKNKFMFTGPAFFLGSDICSEFYHGLNNAIQEESFIL
jgi:hypothetical protein